MWKCGYFTGVSKKSAAPAPFFWVYPLYLRFIVKFYVNYFALPRSTNTRQNPWIRPFFRTHPVPLNAVFSLMLQVLLHRDNGQANYKKPAG